jgi:hypothetical protein
MAVTVVGGYKNLVPKLFFRRGVIPEFDYFKKFQVFDFLKSLAPAKSCHKRDLVGRFFFKSVCSRQKILKSCSRQKVRSEITPAKLVFENGGLLLNYPVSKLLILVFGARQIPTRRAGARNTFKEPAGGMVGYSKPVPTVRLRELITLQSKYVICPLASLL